MLSAADGSAAVLRRFIDGHPPDDTDPTCASMAGVLGRIHREAARLDLRPEAWFPSLRRFDWTTNPWWDLESVAALEAAYPEVGPARHQLEEVATLFDRFEGLPQCLIHSDFHRGNLIARGSEIVGVVDWDLATIDWRILDVGAGMRSWMLQPGQVGFAAAIGFIDRYSRTVGDFSPAERRYLPDVLWLRSLWTVFYDLGRALDGRLDADALRYRLKNHQQIQEIRPGLRAALAGQP